MFTIINEKPQTVGVCLWQVHGCLWLRPASGSSFIVCTFAYFRHHPILAPHHPLHSICACLDKFKNPCSFSSTTLHILSLLLEMLYPSPSFFHHECLCPAKNSSRKLLRPHQTELWPFLPLSSPSPIITHCGPFSPGLSCWGARTIFHLALCPRHSVEYVAQRRHIYWLDNSWSVCVCVCADRLERQTEKNLWERRPKWIHFPVPQIKRRKNRRTLWWCGIVIMSAQKISVPSEKSRWVQLEAWLAIIVLSF